MKKVSCECNGCTKARERAELREALEETARTIALEELKGPTSGIQVLVEEEQKRYEAEAEAFLMQKRQEMEAKTYRKVPVGVTPEQIWKEHRVYDLASAIGRYLEAGLLIPIEWVEEYNRPRKEAEGNG